MAFRAKARRGKFLKNECQLVNNVPSDFFDLGPFLENDLQTLAVRLSGVWDDSPW
jgi:hypothetical protein